MSHRQALTLFSLALSLSCAVPPPRHVADVTEPVALAPRPPSAADDIEALLASHMTGLAGFEVRRTAEAIVAEAARNRVEPRMVLAVIHTESGYYNFARSSVGALGLMQIMPATGEMLAREAGLEWSGPDDLFTPELNVRLGVRYLALLHAKYGSWQRALAAYNWGPAAIDRRLADGDGVPQVYVQQVYSRLARQ
jgi:soluble lytic murein transglycosylase-like protein